MKIIEKRVAKMLPEAIKRIKEYDWTSERQDLINLARSSVMPGTEESHWKRTLRIWNCLVTEPCLFTLRGRHLIKIIRSMDQWIGRIWSYSVKKYLDQYCSIQFIFLKIGSIFLVCNIFLLILDRIFFYPIKTFFYWIDFFSSQ